MRPVHIIVVAEVVNTSSDVQQLPMVLDAVKANTGAAPAQVLADAGYRSEAVMAELATSQPTTELVIALGREGKTLAKPRDEKRYPYTAAMAAKFETKQCKGQPTESANGLQSRPMAGSRVFWGFVSSACGGLEKAKAEFKLVCMALKICAGWVRCRWHEAKMAKKSRRLAVMSPA